MKNRSPIAVFLLTIVTLGIYGIVWYVKTKGEMNKQGAEIPTAWLIIIPLVNIWWLWKYSEGVEKITGGKTSGVLSFVLLWLLGSIGMAIVQSEFNSKSGPQDATAAPVAPAPGFGAPSATEAAPSSEASSADKTPPAPTV